MIALLLLCFGLFSSICEAFVPGVCAPSPVITDFDATKVNLILLFSFIIFYYI